MSSIVTDVGISLEAGNKAKQWCRIDSLVGANYFAKVEFVTKFVMVIHAGIRHGSL